jgi:nucleotide-binding universal stress UspA family protein
VCTVVSPDPRRSVVYRTIVVGAHKSASARRAVAEAIELAQALDSYVHLVAAYPDDGTPADGSDSPGRMDAERNLDAMVPAGRARRFTTHALPGDPAAALLTVADEVGADLIVVGNKGMKGRGRFLGSVPNDVAHRAVCAVLVVRST